MLLTKHKSFLYVLLRNNLDLIYIGDRVRVSDRWAEKKRGRYKGRVGEVVDINSGSQGAFNVNYLEYKIRMCDGRTFKMYYYVLDRVFQTLSNELLESSLNKTVFALE